MEIDTHLLSKSSAAHMHGKHFKDEFQVVYCHLENTLRRASSRPRRSPSALDALYQHAQRGAIDLPQGGAVCLRGLTKL